jgi:hypothetical protein
MEACRMKTAGKLFVLALTVLLFAAFPGCSAWERQRAQEAALESYRARYKIAEAMFQERCKKAGEFIYRTAENVEGVFLLKVRERNDPDSQYKMDDPYGHDSTGENYIKSFFLEPMLEANKHAKPEALEKIRHDYRGYRYVDAIDLEDGKRYRYTGSVKEVTHTSSILMGGDGKTQFKAMEFVLDKVLAPDPAPRYGVTYDDISTREERDYWIAGSSLRVIDLQTNEVMAERIGYMMDRGQGDQSGGRSPWLMAANHACPSFRPLGARVPSATYQLGQTGKFIFKVIKFHRSDKS